MLLARLLATIAAVLLLGLAVVALLAGTAAGTRWLLQAATDSSDGRLEIRNADGTLLGGLSLDALRIDTGTLRVDVEQAELVLHWPDLLRGRLSFDSPSARLLRLSIAQDPDAEPGDGSRIELPVAIAVRGLWLGRLEIAVREPGTAEASPVILEDIDLSGRFAGGVVGVEHLSLRAYGVDATLSGRVDTGRPYALEVDLDWQVPAADVSGEGTATGSLEALELVQRVRPRAGSPDAIAVTGTLRVLDGVQAALVARWSRLERELPGVGLVRSEDGRLEVEGGPAAWRASLRARARLPLGAEAANGGVPALLRARARGDTEGLVLESLRADILGGTIAGRGTLDFAGPAGAFEFAGRELDPAELLPRMAGEVGLEGRLAFEGAGFDLQLARLEGEVAARRWEASGRLSREDGVLVARNVDLRAGPNRLRAEGRWTGQLDARFSLLAPELEVLWPGLAGALEAEGTLGGTPARPSGTLRLSGTGLSFAGTAARRLRLVGSLGSGERLDVELDVTELVAAGTPLGSLRFDAEGRLADFGTRLEIAGGRVGLRLAGRGAFEAGEPTGAFMHTLDSGLVNVPGSEPWLLSGPADIRYADGALGLGAHCWSADDARLCFGDSTLSATMAEATLRLEGFPLATLAALAGDTLELDGTLDGQLELSRRGRDIEGRLRLAASDAVLLFRTPEGDELRNRIERLDLALDADDGVVRGQANLRDGYGMVLEARGSVTDPLGEAPRVELAVEGGIPDLGRLSPLLEQFADVGELAGEVALSARLDGALRAPELRGALTLEGGALAVPAAGILVEGVELRVEGRPDGRADVRGRARSGAGEVELAGTLRWAGSPVPQGELTLRGRRFQVVRLPEGTAEVTPQLELALAQGVLEIAGRVEVPQAEIRLRELGNGGVEVSPDVVVHGREQEEAPARDAFFVLRRVEVVLGDDVSFAGFGLTAALGGQLVLTQASPAADIRGDGVIRITEGRFRTLGQQLDIERGAIIFAGDLRDPALDVRAVREVTYEGRIVKAGLILTGTASNIQSRVYSEPAMGEMDALSYLTTGRPLSAAGSGDRLSVSNAAVTLGLRGALPVAQKLGSALNVDEVGIAGGDELDDTAVVVGEQIGSDLFLRYSYGIFNRAGTIKATYRLNRRVSIEASSGEEQALDLLYSVTW